jgi:hypothetical protein
MVRSLVCAGRRFSTLAPPSATRREGNFNPNESRACVPNTSHLVTTFTFLRYVHTAMFTVADAVHEGQK